MKAGEELASLSVANLLRVGWLTSGDAHFSRLCVSGDDEKSSEKLELKKLIFAAVSRSLRQGHACVPLEFLANLEVIDAGGARLGLLPDRSLVEQVLGESAAITRVGAGRGAHLHAFALGRRRPTLSGASL
jgi:hypothetical protein